MTLLGLFFGISAVTLQMAYQYGKASVVGPVQEMNIILTIVLAVIFLKERDQPWKKVMAGFICFIDVLLVS